MKQFSRETVWQEFSRNLPTLVKLLSPIIHKPEENKPLVCFILSLLVKLRCPTMAIVQRAISVVLYGDGIGKEVIVIHFLLARNIPI